MSSRPEGASPPPALEPIFEVFCSRHFTGWLAETRLSLCFTTYQAGKLFFLGLNRDGRLSANVTSLLCNKMNSATSTMRATTAIHTRSRQQSVSH